eukprot:superscaffoldBa00004595_g19144
MKNIERVWKAEQKYEAERKKIEELQKELKEERAREEMTRYAEDSGAIKKKDDRLDWMYQGPAGQVSRDEYLLGRPIDKQITDQYEEPESGPSAETGLLPGSIFNPATPASNLDMAAKIREDPLFEIRSHSRDESSADAKSHSHHLPGYGLQLPAGRHHQSSAPTNHSGRHERSRSRSPHRNNRESHSSSSSSYRSDRKVQPRAPSPKREHHYRQRNHVSK